VEPATQAEEEVFRVGAAACQVGAVACRAAAAGCRVAAVAEEEAFRVEAVREAVRPAPASLLSPKI